MRKISSFLCLKTRWILTIFFFVSVALICKLLWKKNHDWKWQNSRDIKKDISVIWVRLKGTIVNWTDPSINERSLEISTTVPLTREQFVQWTFLYYSLSWERTIFSKNMTLLLLKLRENNLSEEHDFITPKVEREQFVRRTWLYYSYSWERTICSKNMTLLLLKKNTLLMSKN